MYTFNRDLKLLFLFSVILFWYYLNSENKQETIENKAFSLKFISCTVVYCGGIGNQLFRGASLFIMGRFLNRTPYFNKETKCLMDSMDELKTTFPNFYKYINITKAELNSTFNTNFVYSALDNTSLNHLKNVKEKYLVFNQNLRFPYAKLQKYENEIKTLFDFSEKLKFDVDNAASRLFKNDTSHKLCCHIRRGDFLQSQWLESRTEFVVPALHFIYSYVQKQTNAQISLVFFGSNSNFIKNLSFNQSLFYQTYNPTFYTRGHDMAFGARHCDSFLISATASTFAWWIAFFLPPNVPVFYNSNYKKNGVKLGKEIYTIFYPKKWFRLDLNSTDNTIKFDN